MQLGIGSYTYTWAVGVGGSLPVGPLTALGLLNKAAELGVNLVQICDNLPLIDLPDVEIDAIMARASELGISIELGTRGISEDNLARHLELAKRLGSQILRVVVDSPGYEPSPDEIVETIGGVVSQFEAADICIAIENHDRFPAAILAGIVDRIGSSHVGVCLDTVNSFGSLEGPGLVVSTLGRHVMNLHIKDFDIRRVDHQMGFVIEGTPAGAGRLDVPWLLKQLADAGRDVNAILELWTPPEEELQDTIAKEDAWAKQSIDYLRTIITD